MSRASGASERLSAVGGPAHSTSIWPVLTAAAVVFLALRFQCASIPLERDEGEYAYIAQRVLRGEVPYRDIFDQKPPGVFAAFLLPVSMFGTSVRAIHWTLYAWTALTATALFALARELAGRPAAAWSVLVFGLITIEPSWLATAANTEQFMLLPIVVSAWFTIRGCRSGRLAWWLGAGAAAMTACWFKQTAMTNFLFLPVLAELAWRDAGVRRPGRAVAGLVFAGGVVCAALPVFGYFAAHRAIEPFVDCVWRHNVTYASSVPWAIGLELLKQSLVRQSWGLWLVWALALAALFDWRRSVRVSTSVCGAWMLASLAGVSVGLYFRDHYFIQLAPPLALAAGISCSRLAGLPRSGPGRLGAGVATAALVIVVPLVAHWSFFAATSGSEQSRILYGPSPFADNDRFAEVIRSQTQPGDRVLIFGSEPQLLFQAERRSATRYIFFYPLMMGLPRELERQQEAFAEISESPPQCVVWTNLQTSLLVQPETHRFLHEAVGGMLAKDYRIVAARLMDASGIRILTDPLQAQIAWNAAGRGDGSIIVDMVVLVRK